MKADLGMKAGNFYLAKGAIMKKAILTLVIVVMISMPCLAEVETESFFSVEGTWGVYAIEFMPYDPPYFYLNLKSEFSFYEGVIYFSRGSYWTQLMYPSYIDLPMISIAYGINPRHYFVAIMQPIIGLGVFSWMEYAPGGCNRGGCYDPSLEYRIGLLFRKFE
jgi:hypothetical protein